MRVSTADGDEYSADHVIFTASLGVLKADHEKIFVPPLPEKKRNAIEVKAFNNFFRFIFFSGISTILETWHWKKCKNFDVL